MHHHCDIHHNCDIYVYASDYFGYRQYIIFSEMCISFTFHIYLIIYVILKNLDKGTKYCIMRIYVKIATVCLLEILYPFSIHYSILHIK